MCVEARSLWTLLTIVCAYFVDFLTQAYTATVCLVFSLNDNELVHARLTAFLALNAAARARVWSAFVAVLTLVPSHTLHSEARHVWWISKSAAWFTHAAFERRSLGAAVLELFYRFVWAHHTRQLFIDAHKQQKVLPMTNKDTNGIDCLCQCYKKAAEGPLAKCVPRSPWFKE